jgi:hypothetical protein
MPRYSDVTAVGAILESPSFDEREPTVRGQLRGRPVVYRRTLRGAGTYSEWWIEIEIPIGEMPLQLALRPQTAREVRLHAQGLAVDLILDDRRFDEAFIVEAAPTDVVRALLDADVRRRLIAIYPLHLASDTGLIRLEMKADTASDDVARAAVEVLVDLVDRIPRAVVEADRQATRTRVAYRDNATAAADIQAARAAELAKIDVVRAARHEHQRRVAIAVLLGAFGLACLLILLQRC